MIREDVTNQIFGNRKVIRNYCEKEDWLKINKPIPKEFKKFRLTQCLNCGAILPADLCNLKKAPPKKCTFCSNIGNHYKLQVNTNTWVINEHTAICNVIYKDEIISFYIDADDYEKVSKKQWRISQKRQKYYVISGSNKKGTGIYLHQFLLAPKEGFDIDHIDGNSLNNRKVNLRYVTHQENNDNILATRIDNHIGIRGISYNKKSHLYQVDFSYHKKRYYLKPWKTLEEAIYCRYCCEQYFNLHMLENNPNFKLYDFSIIDTNYIQNYILHKISEN